MAWNYSRIVCRYGCGNKIPLNVEERKFVMRYYWINLWYQRGQKFFKLKTTVKDDENQEVVQKCNLE